MNVVGTIRQWLSNLTHREEEAEEALPFPDNPYVAADLAGFMFKVVNNFVSSAFALVEHDPGVAFLAVNRLLVNTSQAALSHIDPVSADRAWAWEIARLAYLGFAHDTDPDAMYAPMSSLRWTYEGYVVTLGAEVVAFVDAAFRADPESALRVADSLRWHGPRAFTLDSDDVSDTFKENRMARTLNTFVVLDLCGTYGAQAAPDWMNLVNSPIAGGQEAEDDEYEED